MRGNWPPNVNHGYEIDARVPSILIAGGSNFPVRQKEKQNAARDSNMQEWQYIQGLLDKIRSTGMGGIRQDDPQAIPKLQKNAGRSGKGAGNHESGQVPITANTVRWTAARTSLLKTLKA